MKATVAFCIAQHGVNGLVALFIKQTTCFFILTFTLCKVIIIYASSG